MESLQNLMIAVVLALACAILAQVVSGNKARLLAYTEQLVQKAEQAVQGSGLGAEKKKMVIAQLEAAGVTVTSWLSTQIDGIVAALNSKSAWLVDKEAGTGE